MSSVVQEGWGLSLLDTLVTKEPWNHSDPAFQSPAPAQLPLPFTTLSEPGLGSYFPAQKCS